MSLTPQLLSYTLGNDVKAFSTMRHGGISQGNYAEFNINYYCGDDVANIEANRHSLCRLLGIDKEHLVYPHQVHGIEVRQIGEDFPTFPTSSKKQLLEGVDAVMTDVAEICIGVSTADCIPILLYDEAHHACCAVHAGWRGTVQRVVQQAIHAMVTAFHTAPSYLRAVIGPGISLENFEVGDEVYDQFAQAAFPMDRIARRYEKWHIDLWECNRLQLTDFGISPQNITISGICTYAQADNFFSARRLGINSGRIFTGIMIRENQL